MKLLRTFLGLGVVATTLALTATPASADHDYYPGPGDFADCPAKPAGVRSWTCYASTALDGGFTLGSKKGVRVLPTAQKSGTPLSYGRCRSSRLRRGSSRSTQGPG